MSAAGGSAAAGAITESRLEVQRGRPLPLGAWPVAGGINFAVFSRHATSVELMIYDPADAPEATVIKFDIKANRTGDIWHVWIGGVSEECAYSYHVDGPYRPEDGLRFNRMRALIDPYARALRIPAHWDFTRARSHDPAVPDGLSEHDNSSRAARAVVVGRSFNSPALAELGHPWANTVIYETHVRGLTIHPSSAASNPGTYLGVIDKLPYLKALGVTAIELLPVQEFNPRENPRVNPMTGVPLVNYWGYSPVAFFAPASRYAKGAGAADPEKEFREMVAAAHRAGIEVILDVVFNHTAEGDEHGPTLSFRGFDNPIYYLLAQDRRRYVNFSGCGNTLNCNHPVVRELILDCLRHWAVERGIDGFRFDLASILGRDREGHVASNPPLLEAIAEDPILSSVKLIAEAWDLGGAYQLGSFPGQRWSEWNGRFRDDVRRFWRGDPGMVSAFASRLCGSADIYQRYGKQPLNSINFITCHDGMTLNDLVSYSCKHNEANGEDNLDGAADDYSANYGVEGPTADRAINRVRRQQAKNLMATLMLSRGVPMMLGGDEFMRTQLGNNNAYCQDNEISWYDWRMLESNREFFEFTRRMIAFRASHPAFAVERFYEPSEIVWFNPTGAAPDWSATENRLGCIIIAGSLNGGPIAMLFNAEDRVAGFQWPEAMKDTKWRIVIDTAADGPADIVELSSARRLEAPMVAVAEHSLMVLEADNT
jgi:isoamylase